VVAPRIAWSAASCFSDNGASTRPQRPVYTDRCLVLFVWSPRLRSCAEAQAVVNVVDPALARTSRLDCVAVVGQASRVLSPGLQQACYAHARIHRLGDSRSMELESDNPTSPSTISTTFNVAL